MEVIKAPHKIPENSKPKIFLAGSIEMGVAEDWQTKVSEMLEDEDVILLNPRRDAWNSTWEQTKENPDFKEQVEWELNSLTVSDYIIMYFDPKTKSPISLLETGLFAHDGKLLIVCPSGFWRKGNVDIVSEKYNIPQFENLEKLVEYLIPLIRNYKKA
ncbi:MAG: nucleoside 2-deoxyribosyltransferase domain-containing protein [Candidatus Pacebacteria bacterium]|nr:nucleoside 2-deoxyribosyltransferase domain-containing protein [Candidatus Paceibacterota bacterium]MBP9772852.1 nucleoside 2-deoxyribosyltransferase domain-containing protein [Candidatus Paceibacterota bacterium]QQR76341.1 MAG: nucleoside 2-deoxyribosyltransferase domain-containing protein [Candidatus Nomurabacteria bacterium]